MDIDIGLLQAIYREGMSAFYEYNISPNMLEDRARIAFRFIEEHWQSYKEIPKPDTIRMETGIDIIIGPVEPLDFWCKKIRERNLYNNLNEGLQTIAGFMTKVDPDSAFASMQSLVYKLSQDIQIGDRPSPIFSKPLDIIKDYERSKLGILGIPTPWPTMNELTKGWQPADFALVAARPGSGKTWTLLIIAVWAWINGYKVLLASTEMSHKSLKRRAVSLVAKLSYKGLRDGSLTPHDEQKLKEKLHDISGDKRFLLFGDGFDVTINSIEAAIIEHNPDIVFIDGIYLLKTTGKFEKSSDSSAEIFKQTKALAKRRKIPILASTQMNRPPKGAISAAGGDLSRLAFSDTAGQIADYVFYLNQTNDMKKSHEMEIEPAKLREADFIRNLRINWKFGAQDFSEILDVEQESNQYIAPTLGSEIPEDDPW